MMPSPTRTLLLLIGLIIPFFPVLSQTDSTLKEIPFGKGAWISGLSGNLKALTLTRVGGSGGSFGTSNEYNFLLSSGHFIADRLAIGLNFQAARRESRRLMEETSESFVIGPFVRYYLSKNPKGSMYLTGGINYGKLIESSNIVIQNVEYNIRLDMNGPGVAFGIGYSHFLTKNIGLDVLLQYDFLQYKGNIENGVSGTNEIHTVNGIRTFFGFGFIIIIPEFAF